jgi:hypothetical protein
MKFKAIFSLFNGVLILSFLMIFLMPLFLLGTEYFSLFWARNWAIALVFIVTLAALNAYFFMNWGLFRHLEREDWPGLVSYLEERILGRGMTRPMFVRMILNAYLITSNTEGILALESFLRVKRPTLIARFSLQFGIPYLLMKDPAASEAYFRSKLEEKKIADRDWIRWNRSFSLIQMGKPEEAKVELMGVLEVVREPVLRMLCLYLLDVFARQDSDTERRVREGRSALTREITQREMGKRIEKSGENMEVVILSKIVLDARDWLYAEGTGSPAPRIAIPEASVNPSAG